MKKKIIVILQILILLICNVHTGVIAESSNLMDNGGFERDLTSWRTNINESVSKISTYAYSGNKSLKLTGQESEQFLYYYVNNVDINKSYELSAYVKAENLTKDGFYMAILPVDSKNRALGWYFVNEFSEHKAINKTGGTHDWKRISHVVDGKSFDEKTAKLQIYCFIDSNTQGSVLVDDISFKIADVNVYPEFERTGNIIVSDEENVIPLICENNLSYRKNISVDYTITDDRNMILAKDQDSFSVKALCMEKHNVSVPIDKYGAYDVELTISDDDGFLKTQKVRFCKIMKDNSQSVSDDIGVAMHNSRFSYHNTPADSYYKAFKTAGCSFIRDELRWEDVEKVKGQYGVTDKIEETYSAIIANDLKALVILGYGNTLYGMENIAIVPTTEEQLKGFENYVRFTVDYLKKKGFSKENLVFEVWNEYSGGMSNKTGVSDEHYVNLISIVKTVTEEIMPGVQVMTEGMAHVINGGGKKRFQTYCDTDAVDYADVLGMHPYTRPDQPDVDNLFEGAVDDFRNILKASGKEDRPIYHSEVGWCIYKDDKYTEYSERESAVSMIRLFTLNKKMQKKYNQNDVLIIYKGANQNYSKATEQYGILDFPWDESGKLNAKLPYVTLNTAVSLIDDATFIESNEDENLKIYRFKKSDGRDLLVMWTEEDSEAISLDCNGTPEIYDMAGNPTDACVTGDSFNLCVTREPVIVMGSLDDIEPEFIEIYTEVSNTVVSGEKAYITFNIDESGKEINVNPELPCGWEWENSHETFYGGKENTLIFKTPKSDKDSLNSVKLNFSVDNSEYINVICDIEVLADIYGENLVADPGMEGNEWQISNASFAGVDRTEYHSGTQSIKLTGVNGDGKATYVSSPLPEITLDESGKYLMSLWMNASGNNDVPVRMVLNSQECWIHEQMIKPSDEWIKYSVEVNLSKNHTGKIYNFTVETTDDFEGTLWIDDAELVKVYDRDEYNDELLKNPGMESEEWWARLGKSETTEFSKEEKRNGFQSMKMIPGAWVRSEIFEVDENTVYNFSVWLKGRNRVLLYVTAFDENMNELPSIWGDDAAYGTSVYDDSKFPPMRNDWSKVSVDVTPETYVEGTKYIRMAFRVLKGTWCGETTPVYADDASMIKKTGQGDIQNVNTWTLSGASVDTQNTVGKEFSIKMTKSNTAVSVPFKVDYTKKYLLSAYVRSEQSTPGTFAFKTGTDDKAFRDEFYFAPRQNRVKYSTVVDFSDRSDSEYFYIMLATNNSFKGSVWVDDISFEPINEKMADAFYIDSVQSGTVRAYLHGESRMPAILCWTLRDSEGRLKECKTDAVSLGIGFNEFSAEFNEELSSGDTVAIFVWDNFSNMTPIKLSDEYIIK